MSEFIDHMMGPQGKRTPDGVGVTSYIKTAQEIPDLAEALHTVLFYVCNKVDGNGAGVRNVGEKCAILVPDVEAMVIDPRTGKSESMNVGDFKFTIEKTK